MNEEQVMGVIPNVSSGILGQKMYNLVVTDRRLVVVQLTSSMIKEEVKRVTEELKEQGAGRLKRMGATMTAGINLYRRYFSMPVADIFAETNGNFSIGQNQVKKISFKNNFSDKGKDEHELTIKWEGGKLKFRFSDTNPKEAKAFLAKTFENIVK